MGLHHLPRKVSPVQLTAKTVRSCFLFGLCEILLCAFLLLPRLSSPLPRIGSYCYAELREFANDWVQGSLEKRSHAEACSYVVC